MAILELGGFRTRSIMPSEDVDWLEEHYPGFIVARIAYHEGKMNARLAKRYAVPFSSSSPPDAAVGWIVDLVTLDAYLKRGFNPSAEQDGLIPNAAETAKAEILEAANSETGLFELPLRQDAPSSSGVSKGEPFGYSEQSPYTWTDRQREAIADGEG
jgi:hypothetical protein